MSLRLRSRPSWRIMSAAFLLEQRLVPTVAEFIDPNPAPGNQFGATVLPLTSGNVVITSPLDDAGGVDAGAVYVFNGATGALISTLTGSKASDNVGSGGLNALANGHFVVRSPNWDNGAATNAGAVTWGNGSTGISGAVSVANSLVGSLSGDLVGSQGITVLPNGNYLVASPFWDNGAATDAGAMTWADGSKSVAGVVSAANSLVGSKSLDAVGCIQNPSGGYLSGAVVLANGNYIVQSGFWDNGAVANPGAVTWGDGTKAIAGLVTASNSLIGSTASDYANATVVPLTNGHYVVAMPNWDNGVASNAGAVTWGDGTKGVVGPVSPAISLVGTTSIEVVGTQVLALKNGHYVVSTPRWDNGAVLDVGAVTWCDGTKATIGNVTAANSLIGSQTEDYVGSGLGVSGLFALSNGNYIVNSSGWRNGSATQAGAMTWCDGSKATVGVVSAANSLVGSNTNDLVGNSRPVELTNGNFVVAHSTWDNGAVVDAGAATWVDGTKGIAGPISAANSLVGTTNSDQIGFGGAVALTNGNYVVASNRWTNAGVSVAGAATWGDGTKGVTGVVSTLNSLVGTQTFDHVGGVVALANGHYVAVSPFWDNGGTADVGAVTWCDGTKTTSSVVSPANSLIGSTANDQVGNPVPLPNGNYVAHSAVWNNGAATDAGAVTWVDGSKSFSGVVSAANSLVGSTNNDRVGANVATVLPNGNYVVLANLFDAGALVNAGAVTWGSGTSGVSGTITTANSLIGTSANTAMASVVVDNVNGTFSGRFVLDGGGRVRQGLQAIGLFPPTATVTIDSGTGQRSMIQSITITFSEPVVFTGSAAAAIGLQRLASSSIPAPNGPVTLNFNPPAGPASSFTITFNDPTFAPAVGAAKSLIDGKYELLINGAQVQSAVTGHAFDGEADGVPGGNQTTSFHRLFGDLSGEGITDLFDFVAFRLANGSDTTMVNYNPAFDSNGDGFIDIVDLTEFRQRMGLAP